MSGVYKAISAVAAEMAAAGISKDRKNQAQGYAFRGIDDVYNALAPVISKHGLCILPRMLDRVCEERANAKGTALFYVTVKAEFDLVSAEDGSLHTISTYGEAMDSGDKATNKAMSAAFKYACMQAFCIPTEGDNDADAHTHEVAPRRAAKKPEATKPAFNLDTAILYMESAESVEDLKKRFAESWNASNPESKEALKLRYDELKSTLESK